MMGQDRFGALCDAYGSDIDRWPEAERQAAHAFAEAKPLIAQPRLEAARALDEALSSAVIEPASEALYQRIVAEGIRVRTPQRPTWAAAAAAVMLTLGLGAGWVAAPVAETPADDVYASAFGAFDSADALSLEEDV